MSPGDSRKHKLLNDDSEPPYSPEPKTEDDVISADYAAKRFKYLIREHIDKNHEGWMKVCQLMEKKCTEYVEKDDVKAKMSKKEREKWKSAIKLLTTAIKKQ